MKLAVSLVSQTSLKSFKREELTKVPLHFSPEPELVIYIKNNVLKTRIRKCSSCVFKTIYPLRLNFKISLQESDYEIKYYGTTFQNWTRKK